ncbi:MAG: nicotinate (nicotinamide) nucleotide adenylyltransferase [Clostridia bacterium]|nr:nicotinate (nicotinamide) nucleotide adenylyltransferase [Clostridia bacterium]
MEKIGFFGGCFNPPTNVHIQIANKLIKQEKLDKVIFVPVNDYYKKQNLLEAKHRYNMLKLATKNYFNLKVDDIEIKENRQLYAIDAFRIIKNSEYGNKCDIYFIMGSDNFKNMPNWKNYDKIKNKYKYIVIERDEKCITSTQIRKMLQTRKIEVRKYLCEKVYEYIIKNELYKQ